VEIKCTRWLPWSIEVPEPRIFVFGNRTKAVSYLMLFES